MQYVNLGKTGMKISRLALGMMTYGSPTWRPWVLDEEQARPFVKRALDLGINFFDTADMYSVGASEEVLGNSLKHFGVKRQDVIVATKVFNRMGEGPNDWGLSRKHILDSIDNSLRRLQMDYVDLYQIHRWDYETPIEETMEALNDLVRAGKVRYIGASSMFAWQFVKAQYVAELHGWTRFVSMQNHYNLIYREEEREMIPCCLDQGVALIPWSPLARGFFNQDRRKEDYGDSVRAKTDEYGQHMYYRDEDFLVSKRVQEIAEEAGVSGSQVALAWVLNKPYVTAPIIGASKMHHLEENVAALDIQLSDEQISRLEEAYQPHPILGHS